jgi:flagellar hook assembly protein FlgD
VPTLVDLQDIGSVAFQVDPLYPNPFNARIQLTYQIPVPGRVQADLYDVLGRRVRSWSQRLTTAGRFTWRWDGRDRVGAEVASGVYAILLRYTAGDGSVQTATRRMVLLR